MGFFSKICKQTITLSEEVRLIIYSKHQNSQKGDHMCVVAVVVVIIQSVGQTVVNM